MSETALVRADPPIREDGRCVVCLGPRQAKRGNYSDPTQDPFCSTPCARRYFGTELETQPNPGRAGKSWN